MKKILMVFSILFCIFFVMTIPAIAADYNSTVQASWISLGTPDCDIGPNTDHKLVYNIHANEATFGGNYIFTVQLTNRDSTDLVTGFDITGYTTGSSYPEILNVELTNSGTTLVYTLSEPTLMTIEVVVRAKANVVYPDEIVDISSDLSRYEGNPATLVQVADESLVQATCVFPSLAVTGAYELTNPTILPVAATTLDFNYIFNTDATFNTLRTNGGLLMYNKGYTLDFSNVIIRINGVNKTYSEWLNESDCPIVFTAADGSALSADHKLTYTTPNSLTWGIKLPFKAVTNSNFTNSPVIYFSGLKASGDVQFNNRGGFAQITPDGTSFFSSASSGSLTAVSAYNTGVSLIRPISGTNSYISANSEQYALNASHSHLLYQELFKSTITSTIRDGTPNVEVTYDIPDGVTVTHIRIPKSGANAETQYDKITLVKDSISYDLGNGGMFLDLTSPTTLDGKSINPFTPGEDVVFEFVNVLKLKSAPGGANSYAQAHTLSFIGTTNVSVNGGDTLVFKATTNESSSISQLSTVVSNKYYMTSYMTSVKHLVGDVKNVQVTTIEKEKPFYFYIGMSTPTYPYYSTHRTDPQDGAGTGVFSSPVFYFSLPKGIKVSGADAAEIVNAAGTPLTQNDINGNLIQPHITNIIDNAGFYPGGTLVEVKLENSNNPDEPFWMRGTTYVRLKVFIESDYDGDETIPIPFNSILLSSWDPNVIDMGTSGSGGGTRAMPASPVTLLSKTASGTYPAYLDTKTLSVTSSEAVRVAVSTMTSSGNLTYKPGDDTSYPKLKAGSSSERFKLYFSNDLGSGTFSGSDVFFILPQASNWKPTPNAPPTLTASGLLSTDYKIYYTTDSITPAGIGDVGVYNRATLSALSWTEMTFTNGEADNAIAWGSVTAIRCQMNLSGAEKMELQIPFRLPQVDASQGIAYGATARGQTIYYLNDTLRHENTYTAAVMLIQSDVPVISGVGTSPLPETFTDVSIDYLTGTLPNWGEFYTYDDFTEDLEIASVKVEFTPYSGSPTETFVASFTNSSYVPQISDGIGGYMDDVDFVKGFKWSVSNPENYVKLGVPGVYRITYITEADGDSHTKTAHQNITLSKNSSTLTITGGSTNIFWNTNLGDSVENYFKQFVTVTDTDVPTADSSQAILETSSPTFDIGAPGTYSLTYSFTDIGGNKKSANVVVSVLYNGTLTGTLLGNGYPVENFVLDIDGTAATTNGTGKFEHELTALAASPNSAPYNISFTSAIPAGLKYSGSLPISGAGSSVRPVPTEAINFDAVSMTVNVTGPTEGILAVKLYKDGSNSPILVNDSVTGNVLFAKDTDMGWFESGDYYFTVELQPGYGVAASTDFTVDSSPLTFITAPFTLGNADITKNLVIEKVPLISGIVWDDANKDSILDSAESGIPSATVVLLDSVGSPVDQTATDTNGYYYFSGLAENTDYAVQVNIPGGFNRTSDFKDDQKINSSNNYRSDLVQLTVNMLHNTDMNAGFYFVSVSGGGNGNGTGGATVVDKIPDSSGEDVNNNDSVRPIEPDNQDKTVEETPAKNSGRLLLWLFLILLLLIVCVIIYKKASKSK